MGLHIQLLYKVMYWLCVDCHMMNHCLAMRATTSAYSPSLDSAEYRYFLGAISKKEQKLLGVATFGSVHALLNEI